MVSFFSQSMSFDASAQPVFSEAPVSREEGSQSAIRVRDITDNKALQFFASLFGSCTVKVLDGGKAKTLWVDPKSAKAFLENIDNEKYGKLSRAKVSELVKHLSTIEVSEPSNLRMQRSIHVGGKSFKTAMDKVGIRGTHYKQLSKALSPDKREVSIPIAKF